jgi:hypothetical protein
MSMYEHSRHELHEQLREVLGPKAAGTLMSHLPPGGFERLATKDDLRETEERLGLRMEAMRQELRAEMHQMGRSLMLSMTTVMAVMLGILFAALRVIG